MPWVPQVHTTLHATLGRHCPRPSACKKCSGSFTKKMMVHVLATLHATCLAGMGSDKCWETVLNNYQSKINSCAHMAQNGVAALMKSIIGQSNPFPQNGLPLDTSPHPLYPLPLLHLYGYDIGWWLFSSASFSTAAFAHYCPTPSHSISDRGSRSPRGAADLLPEGRSDVRMKVVRIGAWPSAASHQTQNELFWI